MPGRVGRPALLLVLLQLLTCHRCNRKAQAFLHHADCCSAKYRIIDCGGNGAQLDDGVYMCYQIDAVQGTCVMAAWLYNETAVRADGVSCTSACGRVDTCTDDWAWEAILGMMVFSSTFLFCSAICISSERRRRRKGLTVAQAYSLPLGVPVLLASASAAAWRGGRRAARAAARIRASSSGSSAAHSSDCDCGSAEEGEGDCAERHGLLVEGGSDCGGGGGGAYGSVKWDDVPIAKLADGADDAHAYACAVRASMAAYLRAVAQPPSPPSPPSWRASAAERARSAGERAGAAMRGLLQRRASAPAGGGGSGSGGGSSSSSSGWQESGGGSGGEWPARAGSAGNISYGSLMAVASADGAEGGSAVGAGSGGSTASADGDACERLPDMYIEI